MTDHRIDVAISGGGHRASVWGLGIMLYLGAANLNVRVRSVASVSGGSVTNAYLSLGKPFASWDTFPTDASAFASRMAGRVWAFWVGLLGLLVVVAATVVAGLVGLGDQVSDWWPVVPVLVSFVVAVGIGPRAEGSFWAWWGTWAYLALFVWLLVGSIAAMGTDWELWLRLVVLIVGLVLAFWLIGIRNLIADRAFRATVCRRDGAPAPLTKINQDPQHVFCATELHGPHHIYLSRDFVWNWDVGLGGPSDVMVATAVQASSNLPGAFPVRWLRSSGHDFVLDDPNRPAADQVGSLALTDGGVYDNMGEQWADGLESRIRQLRTARLGPAATVTEDVSARSGRVMLRLSDWERMDVAESMCDAGRIEPDVTTETGSDADTTRFALVQARSDGAPIATGSTVRIVKRRGDAVTVASDYDAVAGRIDLLVPTGDSGGEVLLLANASAGRGLARLKQSRIPLLGELPGLMSVVSALYDNGTAIRRRDLVGRWSRRRSVESLAEKHEFTVPALFRRGSDSGAIVQIDASPWGFARSYARSFGPTRDRAEAALDFLAGLVETEGEWDCIAEDNAEVATTFRPLGTATTARLLYHGYVLSAVQLHILFDQPLPSDDPFGPSLAGFESWIEAA